ncbi:hypothetical protein BACPLE_01175 [Phocaeicola plebeius DSM 17135]|uniref:Uncharacterized protein n=1 Tax=Phocaeicola plebeius (strain DSM 17135 / JCM 12973 / CCUG 54634 / M2) TaxID=484018 RepID=B5CWT5_PHOPM|nr:hypothetical protein BACPLE_01175 [Phocaeicola plebeius DSM 17135]
MIPEYQAVIVCRKGTLPDTEELAQGGGIAHAASFKGLPRLNTIMGNDSTGKAVGRHCQAESVTGMPLTGSS